MLEKLDWPMMRLGDLAEFRNGINYNKSNFGTGIKVIGVSNFQDYSKPRYAELDQINPDGIINERNLLRDGDIIFVRSNGNRELIGRSLFIEKPPERVTHSAFTIRLRFTSPDIYPKFYTYCFRTPLIRQALTAQGGGTNINNLNQDILSSLKVPLPPLEEQKRIAAVLSAYDALIENSQRRIEILEQMARGLYREWFVQFRYPGHEGVGRVSSPLGPIPAGWEGQFGDMATITRDGINPFNFPDEQFEHFSIPAFDNGRQPAIELGKTILSNKYAIDNSCVLLSKLNPRIPRIWLPQPSGNLRAITSTEFLVLKPKNGFTCEYLYAMCDSDKFASHFQSLAIGTSTSHQRVKPENLLIMPSVIPNHQIVARFTGLVKPMFVMIQRLQRQIENLRQTRDLLLPRLLGGHLPLPPTAEP